MCWYFFFVSNCHSRIALWPSLLRPSSRTIAFSAKHRDIASVSLRSSAEKKSAIGEASSKFIPKSSLTRAKTCHGAVRRGHSSMMFHLWEANLQPHAGPPYRRRCSCQTYEKTPRTSATSPPWTYSHREYFLEVGEGRATLMAYVSAKSPKLFNNNRGEKLAENFAAPKEGMFPLPKYARGQSKESPLAAL